ncbi:MAG: hypothetical protein N2Z75_04315 [Meiothermus sp.]|uniref:hypothetical protein n=1 Tax=Meiothermus sp. TaxID=1955249 RepID=UPI0025CF381F|nr:hypothetical protein [Meiothermus sp.]MCS7068792.1 hypothetical protein [Meiothermus sp.]MCX7601149.1 hypothetical protein [Meiothermus sp.]MDW8425083.1 hypothetical protein [Meiothermus sp.]
MLERLTEQLLEDEGLTDGLSDEEASELVGWLIGIVEDLEAESGELSEQYVGQLRRLGHELARVARRYGVPVEELIDLIELAWEEPGQEQSPKPMQA